MLSCWLFGNKLPGYTMEEVSAHNTKDDCWLVVEGVIYDVSWAIPLHPAGEKSILRYGGTDATTHFKFHSHHARKLWKQSRVVGRVVTRRAAVQPEPQEPPDAAQQSHQR